MFFDAVSDQNILKSNRVWITNDQALNASNAPRGLLGIRLNVSDSQIKRVALRDSFKTIFLGLKKWYKWASTQNVSMEPPKKCLTNADASWMLNAVGAKFYEILTKVKIFDPEHRSVISYDSLGDRKGFRYSIVNLEKLSFEAFRARPHHVGLMPHHIYRYVGDYGIAYSRDGVVTVADPPFVSVIKVPNPKSCNVPDTVVCSKSILQSDTVETYCCSGLSIDLLL
uniref:Uncharacterized protein n=1 Tax=Romanomermis culicivorax TaxID=13658 RepID=A0A915J7H0_ROMCU